MSKNKKVMIALCVVILAVVLVVTIVLVNAPNIEYLDDHYIDSKGMSNSPYFSFYKDGTFMYSRYVVMSYASTGDYEIKGDRVYATANYEGEEVTFKFKAKDGDFSTLTLLKITNLDDEYNQFVGKDFVVQ